MSEVTLPVVESSELKSTNYNTLSDRERDIVDELMVELLESARNRGLDFWLLNPRGNSVRECLSQWVADRRSTSTIGTQLDG